MDWEADYSVKRTCVKTFSTGIGIATHQVRALKGAGVFWKKVGKKHASSPHSTVLMITGGSWGVSERSFFAKKRLTDQP